MRKAQSGADAAASGLDAGRGADATDAGEGSIDALQPVDVGATKQVCVDTRTDLDNCGACGHRCGPTRTCRDGTCGPAPTAIAVSYECTDLPLAIGGGYLYWTDTVHGTVMRMPTAGEVPSPFATGQAQPTSIALFGDTVYWVAIGTSSLMKAPAAGGAPNVVVTSPNADAWVTNSKGINGFTVAPGGAVYFSSLNRVYMASPGGSGLSPLAEFARGGGVPGTLALVGDWLVFPAEFDRGVYAIPALPSGQVIQCGHRPEHVDCQLAVANAPRADTMFGVKDRAYWIDQVDHAFMTAVVDPSRNDGGDGGDGNARQQVGGPLDGFIMGATIQGDTAFIAVRDIDIGDGGEIFQAPLVPGSARTALARDQKVTGAIAADDRDVYWVTADSGTCTIMKIARQ